MPKSRLSAFLYLLGVFWCGVVVGALAYRLVTVNTVLGGPATRKADPEEVRKHIIGEMRDRLKLDNQQVERLGQIMDQTREEFRELHSRLNTEGRSLHDRQIAEISEILRPDQRPAYEQYRKEREAERQRRQQAEKK